MPAGVVVASCWRKLLAVPARTRDNLSRDVFAGREVPELEVTLLAHLGVVMPPQPSIIDTQSQGEPQ